MTMLLHDKKPKLLYGTQLYNNINEQDLLYILAYIIDSCNYSCEYCYNIKPYSNIKINLKSLYEYIFYVKSLYPNKYIQLELIGGEPTLHPDLVDFCEKISHIPNILIKIFTNLSADINFYTKLLTNKKIILIASWHSLNHDKINHSFITKITKLALKYINQLEVRIMYEILNSRNSLYVAEQLVKVINPTQFDLSFIFDSKQQTNDLVQYSEEQLSDFNDFHNRYQIRSNRKEFVIEYTDGSIDIKTFTDMFCNKDFSFKHWLCNAGKNSLFVDFDGSVYPCVEYSFDKNNSIFNIYNNYSYKNYNFKKTICKLKYCSCDWDIKKQKIF